MLCKECDAEVELDEPQQCYYTGRGNCGDCTMNCFHPVLCDECKAVEVLQPMRRSRRQQEIADMLSTRDYRNRRKAELREQKGGRFA